MKKLEKRDRLSLFYVLEEWATNPKTGSNIFLITPADESAGAPQVEITYSQAYQKVLQWSAWLKEVHGVQKGDIVAIDLANRPAFVFLWFGIWALGAVPAFINTHLRGSAFTHCVRIASARLLLIEPDICDALDQETKAELSSDQNGKRIECAIVSADLEQEVMALSPYRAPDTERSGLIGKSLCLLIYTSGTTGLPKAANVNWGKALAAVKAWPMYLEMKPQDRFFTCLPLYHTSGSLLGICEGLGSGCAVVLARRFSARNFMRQVSETKATGIHYIGEMCRYLLASPPSPYDRAHNVRFAFGNGLRPDVWQAFKDRFNIPVIAEFYGATEGPAALLAHSRNDFLRGAVGQSGLLFRSWATNTLLKHDPETDEPYRDPQTGFGVKCAVDEPGELLHPLDPAAIGERYFGYLGNAKASESKIIRDLLKKGDAYYRTGDLLKCDAEGRIWFVDRIGDSFRWRGENVSTTEVSAALGSHPAVNEANVYGVQLPHHDGRAGCAALVLAEGHTLDARLCAELAAHARERLPRYAVPLFLRLSTHVEVTGTHKHQKVALRAAGVDPRVVAEELFWLPPPADRYRRFTDRDWKQIEAGRARL